jgi:predicted dinucleotide-binding enzyme
MAIAIIGRGGMGTALARRFEDAGEKTTLLGRRGSVPKDAGTIFLVVPHGETENALAAAGDLGERILVDVTNPIGPGLNLAVGLTTTAAEEIQKRLPRAKVVKAFNTVFAELLDLDYTEHGNPPQVPYAGDDVAAGRGRAVDNGDRLRAVRLRPVEDGALPRTDGRVDRGPGLWAGAWNGILSPCRPVLRRRRYALTRAQRPADS